MPRPGGAPLIVPDPELRLLTHGRARLPDRLDAPWTGLELADPDRASLLELAADRAVVIWGGEPTLRPDLPDLIAGLRSPTLRTDGLSLRKRAIVGHLARQGLAAVRLPLHSGRRDANDWLRMKSGVTKATVEAARAVVAEGLRLEVETTLVRPTASHLVETVEFAARLGASTLHLRRLRRRGPADAAWIVLSPRFARMEPWLEEAARAGTRLGLEVHLEDLPRCAAPALPDALFSPPPVWLAVGDGAWPSAREEVASLAVHGACGRCPSSCPGAPADYVALFGDREFASEGPTAAGQKPTPVPPGVEAPTLPPPPRQLRPPSTRLRAVHDQLDRATLHGDPITPSGHAPAAVTTVAWTAEEPTRSVRVRLVRASQEGSEVLRIAGGPGLAHPATAALLREATRLSVPELELHGELSSLASLSDDELRRLRRFTRAVAVLEGPDPEAHDAVVGTPGAFSATVDALNRLHRASRRRVDVGFVGDWSGDPLPWPNLEP